MRLLAGTAAAALVPATVKAAAPVACPGPWREWRSFVQRHIDTDGRVVDFANKDLRSTSESQSYALFFALVDNDPVLFDRVLGWTRRHLSAGRPDLNLPAWLWGRDDSGQFRVLDPNTAADGELWIAYALLEAGRLWKRPGLLDAGRQMLALMHKAEVVQLPGFGPMLLPGRSGFIRADRWTLNPSYLPLFVLRRFAAVDPKGPWARVAERSVALLEASAPVGFAPDWLAWNGKAFVTDPDKGDAGSYDAIRCYLWAGMVDPADPLRRRLLQGLSGPAGMLRAQGHMAEKVQVRNGVGTGTAPAGFAAALLPYLAASGQPAALKAQQARVASAGDLNYYERALVLFGKGWMDRRFRFSADGRLLPAWSTPCSANT
ncbi:cellulose synthase complex periplasmic endoglucanase BcsZ [Stenotrophomonas sp. 24(2023)]|uniref:cellulose synthase complex periplasmic endoglucanase BcsZ n=1 Tax=Stenotrophomonas sp. 24(2023) TaxID=3068324 RepID=UPI0027E1E951|nr:cellulose synthase complex periplasmic endoglucanase BcsZ [Stenotrophomonas sp. 24(2023)]WMJ71475.1 cellulose synthase complex periplasmic endoglucanase BcsZ [Stenotrophomonas sp. 24(2023)]